MPGSDEPLWGYPEVARFLRVPVGTVKDWCLHKKFPPGIRVGRHVRWEPRVVRAWLAQQPKAS